MTERMRRSLRRDAARLIATSDRLLERVARMRTAAAKLYELADLDARVEELDMNNRRLQARSQIALGQFIERTTALDRIAEDLRARAEGSATSVEVDSRSPWAQAQRGPQ